ncbi:hypothetical protein FJY70_03115, partial [candidate division WOR-3 bacterium]|nr:hypothetical protein [candidate division WOR-3 bacterium]
MEAWLQSGARWIALATIAAGLVIRILVASPTYLNSDEIDNYITAAQPTLALVFKEALLSPHPPLYFLLLHVWSGLGRSEFMLRLFSVLAGTAGLWLAFSWFRMVFGRVPAIAGLVVLAFAPSLTTATTEVRQYALLFLLIAATLLLLEAGFRRRSSWLLAMSALTSGLAVYSHTSAIWFVIAFGVCGLARAASERLPRSAALTWFAGQVFTAGVCSLVYFTQLVKMRGGRIESFVQGSWLRDSYFRPGEENALFFVVRQMVAVFGFVYSHPVLGAVMLALFLAGIGLLLAGRGKPGPSRL